MVTEIVAVDMAGENGHVVLEGCAELIYHFHLLTRHQKAVFASGVEHGGVGADEDAAVLAGEGEVLFKPGQLTLRQDALVAAVTAHARAFLALAFHVDVNNVIQEHPVVAAYVYAIGSGAPAVAFPPAGAPVHVFSDYARVVVVVAHKRVHRSRIVNVLQQPQAVGFVEIEFSPVDVVREVSEVERVHRTARCCFVSFPPYSGHSDFLETPQVVPFRVGGKVQVGKQDCRIGTLVLLFQHEIVDFILFGAQIQGLPEAGPYAVDAACDIAGWRVDKHRAVLLVGLQSVAPEGVREHYGGSVGDGDALHGAAFAHDATADVAADRQGAAEHEERGRKDAFHSIICLKILWGDRAYRRAWR